MPFDGGGAWLEKHKGMQFMKRCSGALLMNGNSAKIQEREKKQKLNCKKPTHRAT